MKKVLSIIAFLALTLLPVRAEGGLRYLNVALNDGTCASFALADKPTVGYQADQLHIVAGEQSVDIAVKDVEKFTFDEDNLSGIGKVESSFSRLKPGTVVTVVNANGQQVATATADDSGRCAVDLSALPKGIYVISTPTTNIKVTNK